MKNKINNMNSSAKKPVLLGGRSRYATVATVSTVVIIAIFVFLNLIISKLPSNVLQIDISDGSLYSVSDTSIKFLNNLDTDIDLVVIAEDQSMDQRITKFIYNYAALSDHIKVTVLNPISDPAVLDLYEDAAIDTLVVSCEETGKSTVIDFTGSSKSLITYSTNPDTLEHYESAFDADGQITSAINYVTSEASGSAYCLTGHEESEIYGAAANSITKSNIEIVNGAYNLLIDGGIPEDCGLIICNNPLIDLTDAELTMLREYMQSGGDVLLLMDTINLPNFNSLLNEYGLELQAGYVGDTSRYYSQYASSYGYYCFAPLMSSAHDITRDLSGNAFVYYARGMKLIDPSRESIRTLSFLTTTTDGYIYDETTTTATGTCIIGASSTETLEDGSAANLTVISAIHLIDEEIVTSMASMANIDIFTNAVTWNFDDLSTITIPSKSLIVTTNTIDNALLLSFIFIIALPVAVFVGGLIFWVKRRKH